MSRYELTQYATGLEVAANAAIRKLDLSSGEFDWISGEVRHPMPPQRILPDSSLVHDSYSDNVTFYGGGIENDRGNFNFGHIQASISEPLPGAQHSSGNTSLPKPYIPRLLTVHKGIITVDTPTMHVPNESEPLVREGTRSNIRFRRQTRYYPSTDRLVVVKGILKTDGHGWSDDQTTEQDATELPENLLSQRVGALKRTIRATATIFEKIALGDNEVKVEIVRNSRK